MNMPKTRHAQAGQGLVEYAGALVVGAVIVAAVVALGPPVTQDMFSQIINGCVSALTSVF